MCEEDKEYSNPLNQQLSKQAIWTYFVENKLVDEDFPEDTAQKELIHFLSEPEILVQENNMLPKVSFAQL